jgi:hypothetical protein
MRRATYDRLMGELWDIRMTIEDASGATCRSATAESHMMIARKGSRRSRPAVGTMSRGTFTVRTPEKAQMFTRSLAETGSVTAACRAAGISRVTAYGWRKRDPTFRNGWDAALAMGADALEDEARRRAMGWDEPVFHDGRQVGTVRRYSDTLLIFLLKGLKPEKYRERRETIGTLTRQGQDGAPLAPTAVVNVTVAGEAAHTRHAGDAAGGADQGRGIGGGRTAGVAASVSSPNRTLARQP